MKRVRMALAFIMALICALALWACASGETEGGGSTPGGTTPGGTTTEFTLTEFNVAANMKVNLGDEVTVPTVTAKGSDNQTYTATAKVTDSEGTEVEVTSGKFTADDVDGYTITYTVHANDKDFKKTTAVEVFTLTEFEVAETAEANYGEEYTVPAVTAKGSDNQSYPAIYEVTDSKDAPVVINGGKFTATDLEGYTITYTVTANGKDYTKTTALTVVDAAAPVIAITAIDEEITYDLNANSATYKINKAKYSVGDKFVLPEITITDNIDEDLQPSEVYLEYTGSDATDGDAKITIPQEGYTFTKLGEYKLHVVAKDEAENQAEEEITFTVRAQAAEGEIEGFNDPYSPVHIHSGGNMKSLSRSFVTETVGGVKPSNGGYFLKIEATANAANTNTFVDLRVAPRFTKAQLEGWIADGTYDAIEVRFFFETDNIANMRNITTHFSTENQSQYYTFKPVWSNAILSDGQEEVPDGDEGATKLQVATGRILPWYSENYDSIANPDGDPGNFIYFLIYNTATIYVDSIRLVKTAEITVPDLDVDSPTLDKTTVEDLGITVKAGGEDVTSEVTISEVYVKYKDEEYTRLEESYDFTRSGDYELIVNVSSDKYAGTGSFTFRKISEAKSMEYEYFNDEFWKAKVTGGGTLEVVPAEEVLAQYPDSGEGAIQPGDERYGGNFLKISTKTDGSGYINFACAPHMSKKKLRELAGFDGHTSTYEVLSFRWLVHYEDTNVVNCIGALYTDYDGTDVWQADWSNNGGRGVGVHDIWNTVTFNTGDNPSTPGFDVTSSYDLAHLANNYDKVAALDTNLFFIRVGKQSQTGVAASYNGVGSASVTIYIQYFCMTAKGEHHTITEA